MLPGLKKVIVKNVFIRTNDQPMKKKRYDRDCLRDKHSTNEYQLLKRLRAAVEGTFSALKRSQGLDQFKVCGKLKVRCTSMYKALGYNIKQLVRILNGNIRGYIRT